ncbi:putative intracellular protease/amidase [Phenylobacterium zucineum HLK1]|uniref:Putative intracellular protease/amidase n=1 Tax=Phenylobacterium zucineum (strain HLK1) TaxID=450851 RepID=B4RHM2_PHEZH|nr:type 1 glutamine amidotransferase domain-containing protein [Phenylobacterium zucineum]ACG79063.1 putative intracellular protease/amidase [Phenylobacterium zucineum HLK1]
MADGRLQGRKVAVLATDGFEQVELTKPVEALKEAGAEVHIVAPKGGEIQGFNHHDKGDKVRVDRELSQASAQDYDGLVLPGGVINPDQLRLEEKAIDFIRHFVREEKPIAAICHGPWTLIDAGAVDGRKMTSWPSLKTDLRNAGAEWVDQEVVTDAGLVTSRNPDDLPAFCAKMVEEFAEGRHAGRTGRGAEAGGRDETRPTV